MSIHRSILIIGFALLWLPSARSEPKLKPPSIAACRDGICITNLVWRRPTHYNTYSRPVIEGLLVNRSDATISTVSVEFAMKSGGTLRGTAQAVYFSEIPPGGQWSFHASFQETIGTTTITRTEMAIVSFLQRAVGGATNVRLRMKFDPVFNPNLREWKAWEKINGKRQR